MLTTGNFQNQYTFTIVDNPGGYDAQLPLIQTNAVGFALIVLVRTDVSGW